MLVDNKPITERLSIDEIIGHCERKVAALEDIFSKEKIAQMPIQDTVIAKEYWEHKQVAAYLRELKQLREESKWIPVTWRETTENDTPYLDEYPIVLTCPMPDDRQEILISDHGYVCTDVCQIDNQGYWLEGKGDWLDIDAWMPLPKAYEGKE